MRGFFITFEGGEGSGKSTQLARLLTALRADGWDALETQDPGGTPAGREIRRVLLDPAQSGLAPLAELLLYEASRAQLVAEVIRPALAAGRVVLCDRFTDSTVAYQGHGRGLDLALIERLNGLAAGGLVPDCTFLLDVDPAVGLDRVRLRTAADRLEGEALAFHQRVRQGFLALARREPERVVVLDAAAPAEEIARRIRRRVSAVLAAAAAD